MNTCPSTALTPPSCVTEEALVDGVLPIPDNQITATSSSDVNHTPPNARLDNTLNGGSWCGNATDTNLFIMVCMLC